MRDDEATSGTVKRAEQVVKVSGLFDQYVERHGEQSQDRQNLVDLLADLMHLAAARGVDFNDALTSAVNHYSAESD